MSHTVKAEVPDKTTPVKTETPVIMAKNSSEHHLQAAKHHEEAAKHHHEAAKHHEAGNHEKACECTVKAHGHSAMAQEHQTEDVKQHASVK
jgi:hypothetical protein